MGREGMQNKRGEVKEQKCRDKAGSWSPLKGYVWYFSVLFQEWRFPPRWRMINLGQEKESWNTTMLPHHQPISLHTVRITNSEPLLKWLTLLSPFKKLSRSSRIFGVGSWTWVHLLSELLAIWRKQTFLSNQCLSLKYWVLRCKQPNLRSVTQVYP